MIIIVICYYKNMSLSLENMHWWDEGHRICNLNGSEKKSIQSKCGKTSLCVESRWMVDGNSLDQFYICSVSVKSWKSINIFSVTIVRYWQAQCNLIATLQFNYIIQFKASPFPATNLGKIQTSKIERDKWTCSGNHHFTLLPHY